MRMRMIPNAFIRRMQAKLLGSVSGILTMELSHLIDYAICSCEAEGNAQAPLSPTTLNDIHL